MLGQPNCCDGGNNELIVANGLTAQCSLTLMMIQGYWRRFSTTQAVLECPVKEACDGGSSTGQMLCAVGYEVRILCNESLNILF
jgi:hypothetical protein